MTVASAPGAAPATSNGPQQGRTPAWKRLGLKLKFAKDSNDDLHESNGVRSTSLKRALTDDDRPTPSKPNFKEPQARKRRKHSVIESLRQTSEISAVNISSSLKKDSNQLRKRVSFTPETKTEDGDSSKSLIADWDRANDQIEELLKSHYETVSSASEHTPLNKTEETKPESMPQPLQQKSKDALEYLTLFHQNRESWKFNKNREVWILKHVLSTNDIPSTFTAPLVSYIHGLKSGGARARLLTQCQQALELEVTQAVDRDEENWGSRNMEDPSRRKAYHDDAVKRFKRSFEEYWDEKERKADLEDPEYQRWLSKRKRAELLLWAATPPSSAADTASSTSQSVESNARSSTRSTSTNSVLSLNGSAKKRKNRTLIVEVSSSSEDESSRSEEESEGARNSPGKDTRANKSDESDFLTSSSGSDNESESGSTAADNSTASESSSDSTANDTSGASPMSLSTKRQPSVVTISSEGERQEPSDLRSNISSRKDSASTADSADSESQAESSTSSSSQSGSDIDSDGTGSIESGSEAKDESD